MIRPHIQGEKSLIKFKFSKQIFENQLKFVNEIKCHFLTHKSIPFPLSLPTHLSWYHFRRHYTVSSPLSVDGQFFPYLYQHICCGIIFYRHCTVFRPLSVDGQIFRCSKYNQWLSLEVVLFLSLILILGVALLFFIVSFSFPTFAFFQIQY